MSLLPWGMRDSKRMSSRLRELFGTINEGMRFMVHTSRSRRFHFDQRDRLKRVRLA